MRFSPRITIRKKRFFSFFHYFFYALGPFSCTCRAPSLTWAQKSILAHLEGSAPKLAPSGGSSAVEQRTVKCASAAILWSGVQISLSGFLELFGIRCAGVPRGAGLMSYGHTTGKAPHPIRTAKLSTVGPDQYYGRGLRGNLRCCKALFYFLRCVQLLVFVHACDAPGVLAQSEACVLSKHEVLGSKPRYSSPIWCSW